MFWGQIQVFRPFLALRVYAILSFICPMGKKNSSRISQIDFLTIKLLTWQRIWYLCTLPFRALRGMMHWFKPIPLLFLNLQFFSFKGSSHASSSMQLHLSLFILLLPPASPARWVGLFWHKAHLSFSWKLSLNTHSCSETALHFQRFHFTANFFTANIYFTANIF